MDISTLIGILLGFGGILIGNAIEGGHFNSLTQFTAALIVFGGTFGATMISNSMDEFKRGMRMLSLAFHAEPEGQRQKLAQDIVRLTQLARRETLLSIEKEISKQSNQFLKTMLRMTVDGVDAKTLRSVFEHQIEVDERRRLSGAKVWADAGGFAPTIGILGAVLGLIHVMANLVDTSALGKGIAVAFVATIYGVGSANLFFLPVANKIKRRIQRESEEKEMILEGVVALASGMGAVVVEEKMKGYLE